MQWMKTHRWKKIYRIPGRCTKGPLVTADLFNFCCYRLRLFREKVNHLINTQQFGDGLQCAFDDLFMAVNRLLPADHSFSVVEADAALQRMNEQNQLMYSDGKVYII